MTVSLSRTGSRTTPTGNVDVDEALIVASLDSAAAPVAAPLQLPSGIVRRARVGQEEAAAPAPPTTRTSPLPAPVRP